MPESSVTKYCCGYTDFPVIFNYAGADCAKTYTAAITFVNPGAIYWSGWNESVFISRSCLELNTCNTGSSVVFSCSIGCIPKSLMDPFDITVRLYENGVEVDLISLYNLVWETSCPSGTCPEICS